MLRQLEGSRAVAETVARCRPQVICAYPISPQTHIVEALAGLVSDGSLSPCEFVNVESEFPAMSLAIGATAAGSRTYTATASQGLLYMAEALFNAAGLQLPIVMTVANRAIGAPINIWNDHSDSMSMRDSGWIQLYADSNQAAVDLHVQAFRIAEQLSLPVMVCMDGFVLTHAVEALEVPEQSAVDAFVPAFRPRQVLDPDAPTTIGAMVGPEAFTEVKHLAHLAHRRALDVVPAVAADFFAAFGRGTGGLVAPYRCADAETVVVALGSVVGTLQEVADEQREAGRAVGVVGLTTFRPFPAAALSAALGNARRVVVLERAFEVGVGGIVTRDVLASMRDREVEVRTVVAGLGGRPVTRASLHALLAQPALPELTFLDLDERAIEQHMADVGG